MNKGISRFRKGIVGTIVGATAAAGLIPLAATGAGAATNFSCTRLAGADRYGTAVEISKATFASGADTVLLATGEKFPDALAGNYLAGLRGAPILLTRQASLPAETKAEITRLDAENIVILGGTDAVSAAVATEVDAMTDTTVSRVGGADRYETAKLIATTSGTVGMVDNKKTAIVARGDNFPDALAGGPLAYSAKLPILLTNGAPSTTLNPHAKSGLQTLAIEQALILGGTSAITGQVETEIKASRTPNIETVRLAGADRTETARLIAEYALTKLGFSATHVNLARGDEFPDALTGGPHGGTDKAPILLTQSPTVLSSSADTGAAKYAADHKATLTNCHIFGGVAAVSDAVETQFETAAGATGAGTGVTTRPELVAASVVGTVAEGVGAGTTVKYTFDEPVTCVTGQSALFHVVTASGARSNGASCTAVSGDANSVNVLFSGITTAAGASALSLATVDLGAVTDNVGEQNPEGDAGLNTQASQPLVAGNTNGPDLTGITFGGVATSTQTFVTFTFDEAAKNLVNNGYMLIPVASTAGEDSVVCTYNSGTGTTSITVLCGTNPTATTPLSAATFARGVVLAGTVEDTATVGLVNPLEAADISNSGNTGAPDLSSAVFETSATAAANSTTLVDVAILTFDQEITTGAGGTGAFQAYKVDGTEVNPTTVIVAPSTSPFTVRLEFADGALAGAVGVSVDDDAVLASTGTNIGHGNEEDEVGVANTTSGQTAGATTSPELTSVVRTAAKDVFGTPTGGFNVTYVFDEDVNLGATGSFFIYAANGTRYFATSCANPADEATDNTVTCTAYDLSGSTTDATNAQVGATVLGTVDDGAVTAETGGENNNEGAEPIASA